VHNAGLPFLFTGSSRAVCVLRRRMPRASLVGHEGLVPRVVAQRHTPVLE